MPLPEQLTVYNAKCVRIIQAESWFVVNAVLVGLFVIMLLVYVMQINGATTKNYRIKLLNDKISSLNDTQSALFASKSAVDDIALIEGYARANSMIKGDGSVALYGDAGVAMQR